MPSSKVFKRLKNIQKIDFGNYLGLVESIIYETECVKESYEKSCKDIKKKKRNAILLFMFFISTAFIIPVFLLVFGLGKFSAPEAIFCITCIGVGLASLGMQYSACCLKIRNLENDKSNIAAGLNLCLVYIQQTLMTFYNKEDSFKTLTADMPDEEFEAFKKSLNMIEMDFTIFVDIVYRNNRINLSEAPEDTLNRSKSKKFLINYLNDLKV